MLPAFSVAAAVACGGLTGQSNPTDDGGIDATSGIDGSGIGSGSSSGSSGIGSSASSGGVGSSGSSGSGGSSGSSGGYDDSGPPVDATSLPVDVVLPPLDAALASLDAAPAGLAGFAFIVNDVVQNPMSCPGTNWEFAPYPGTGDAVGNSCGYSCTGAGGWGPVSIGSCAGIESVVLVNTGALEMAYIAGPCWNVPGHTAYAPGGYPGGDFLAGVLAPGAYVDITQVYNAGITAVVGSAEPFSSPDSAYASDEGQIPWPLGVQGGGGATTMYVAEIEVRTACQAVTSVW